MRGELAGDGREQGVSRGATLAATVACLQTGTYSRWLLTEAQGNTFVDVEFGMDPIGFGNRIFDAALGRLYFRRWLDQSIAALEEVVEDREPSGAR
jgi:hypothetical protein